MSLKGTGRGTVIATADGQGVNRMRIDNRSWISGEDHTGMSLPEKGTLTDCTYPDYDSPEFQDAPDSVTAALQTATDEDTILTPDLNSNRGKFVRFYFDENYTYYVCFSLDKATGTVHRDDNGQDFFRVDDSGNSYAEEYSTNNVEYPFTVMDNISDDDSPRSIQETVTFRTDKQYTVCFDNGGQPSDPNSVSSFDAESWAWEEV